MSGWIGCDLDGTLAKYAAGSYDHTKIGEIVPEMKLHVMRALAKGFDVKIFTARVSGPDRQETINMIQDWLVENGLPRLEVTNVKDYAMIEIWDDRARQVVMNTGEFVGYSTRGL